MITRKIFVVAAMLLSPLLFSACMATTSGQSAAQRISPVSASPNETGVSRSDVDGQQDQHAGDAEKHNLEILRFVRGF
jgi:hypothetical protein